MHLVILDLDETLIHSCDEWIGRPHDFVAGNKMMFSRPFAKDLVRELVRKYSVAVWTASYGAYTRDIIKYLFEDPNCLAFMWDRSRCLLKSAPKKTDHFVKDLAEVYAAGWSQDSFCLVDDRPEHIIGAPANVISVKPCYGSADDQELDTILTRIESAVLKV